MIRTLTLTLALTLAAGAAPAGEPAPFTLTSAAFAPGGMLKNEQVYDGFGCSGGNVSPALLWKHPPAATQSFALMLYDPVAPTGSGGWHWGVFNLPSTVDSVPAGAGSADGREMPAGAIQGRTDFGTVGYGGACPPPGDKPHRYYFRVYALKVAKLDVPADATAAMIGFAVRANALAVAETQAIYGR